MVDCGLGCTVPIVTVGNGLAFAMGTKKIQKQGPSPAPQTSVDSLLASAMGIDARRQGTSIAVNEWSGKAG